MTRGYIFTAVLVRYNINTLTGSILELLFHEGNLSQEELALKYQVFQTKSLTIMIVSGRDSRTFQSNFMAFLRLVVNVSLLLINDVVGKPGISMLVLLP